MRCRFCQQELNQVFADLVKSPPSNSFLTKEQLNEPEIFFPIKLYVCEHCWLVQIDEFKRADEIFNQAYAYYSSYSKTWLAHARSYTEMIVSTLGLNKHSMVIEIASNDGYLLQYFKQKDIPCLGIEPAKNTAEIASKKGISVICKFFGENLAKELVNSGKTADLLIGNNVLAHVPNINDFVKGLKTVLKPKGVITLEFPHLMRLVEQNQFDTIYHEHFSYFSFTTVKTILAAYELEIFDVEELSTHGGSLRIYVKHHNEKYHVFTDRVAKIEKDESKKEMNDLKFYQSFQQKVDEVKNSLLSFLIEQKRLEKLVIGYGAAAKGNTLLNYCGIKSDLIPFVVDLSLYKQGRYLPGVHIPILNPEVIMTTKPDFVVILPWNLEKEICEQLYYIRDWNGRFVVPIPEVRIV